MREDTRIQSGSIVDHTSRYLEDMIIKGKLRPGQRVKGHEISSQLGISRAPIREAFKILEAEGLIRREPIDLFPNKGMSNRRAGTTDVFLRPLRQGIGY